MVMERLHQLVQFTQTTFMDNEAVEGIAYRDATRLSIADNLLSHLQITFLVEIGVDNPSASLNDRNTGGVADKVDEATTTTGDAEIDIAYRIEQFTGCFVGSGQSVRSG